MLIDGFRKAIDDLVRAARLYNTWYYLAVQDTISRYRRSLLGPLWVAGAMVTTAISLSLVFGALFGQPMKEFLPFVMSGIMAWSIVSLPLTEGPEVFVSASGTIKSVPFPFMFYVFRMMARSLVVLAHNIVVFLVVVIVAGSFRGWHWALIPGLIIDYAFMVMLAAVMGLVAARFRDIRFLVPYLAQIMFFLTPIFWQPKNLVGARAQIVKFNPFYHLLELVRQPLLGHAPDASHWMAAAFFLLVVSIVWLFTFAAFRSRIPFWV